MLCFSFSGHYLSSSFSLIVMQMFQLLHRNTKLKLPNLVMQRCEMKASEHISKTTDFRSYKLPKFRKNSCSPCHQDLTVFKKKWKLSAFGLVPDAYLYLDPPWLNLRFSLALTSLSPEPFSLFHHSVLI